MRVAPPPPPPPPPRVCVVVGGARGIGREVVRRVACEYLGAADAVVLTARDAASAERCAHELSAAGAEPELVPVACDITSKADVEALAEAVSGVAARKGAAQGLSSVVLNAAMSFPASSTVPFGEQAEVTAATNYYGTLRCAEALVPLLAPAGRLVVVSSRAGGPLSKFGEDVQAELTDAALDVPRLSALVERFVASAKAGTNKADGFGSSAYGFSKAACTALTRLAARGNAFDGRLAAEGALSTACCPNLCRTDMTQANWNKSVLSFIFFIAGYVVGWSAYQGADTIAWLAAGELPDKRAVHGCLVGERKRVAGYAGDPL